MKSGLFTSFAAALSIAGAASAQQFSSRPVTMVVPFSVGATQDVVARTLARPMGERLGTAVIVDNRAGASGAIGHALVAKAAPDGHTLAMSATSFVVSKALNPKLNYEIAQFAPVALVATGAMGLVVHPDTPAKNVAELVALSKAKPELLFFSSPGNGTPHHLSVELFKLESGAQLTHIPHKEQKGAVTDLVAGRVQLMISPIFTLVPQINAGKLRLLAMLTPERSKSAPNVPTMKEAGYPNMQVSVWFGVIGPAGMPQDVVARLNKEINAALDLKEVTDVLDKQGLVTEGGPAERFGQWIAAEQQRWPRVVKAANIKVE